VHLLKFQPLEEADVEMQCESTEPPQALATPHTWVAAIPDDTKVVVNFIIGTDGQVYSPFVLDGSGSRALFRKLVDEVRRWHYRPALCNGVPTDAEVKVQLSSR
jgi:TonB family protein